jgi:hypothetical protein
MEYKHTLPTELIDNATHFKEFGNGGAQATIVLNDGRVFRRALISNSSAIIALRGFNELPFKTIEISNVFQTNEDREPKETSDWKYWDEWQ